MIRSTREFVIAFRKALEDVNAQDVARFHDHDDTDDNRMAHHHTLGEGTTQAAPGSSIKELRNRIEALEDLVLQLQEDLATKADASHTHA